MFYLVIPYVLPVFNLVIPHVLLGDSLVIREQYSRQYPVQYSHIFEIARCGKTVPWASQTSQEADINPFSLPCFLTQ